VEAGEADQGRAGLSVFQHQLKAKVSSTTRRSIRYGDPLRHPLRLALDAIGMSFFSLFCAWARFRSGWAGVGKISRAGCNLPSKASKSSLQNWRLKHAIGIFSRSVTVLPARLRPGLNLTTRSQALRLDRHGETAENIARVLEVPPAKKWICCCGYTES
jgi:hypothetical protein